MQDSRSHDFKITAIALACIIVLFSILFYGYINKQKEKESIQLFSDRLQFLVTRLYLYASGYKGLPNETTYSSSGEPLCSWRFTFSNSTMGGAPYGTNVVRSKWPSPDYHAAGYKDTKLFLATLDSDENGDVLAIRGKGTIFQLYGTEGHKHLLNIPPQSIILIEKQTDKHWIEPNDFNIDEVDVNSKCADLFGGNYDGIFAVAFADATIWLLSEDVPYKKLSLFFTEEGAIANDRESILGPYAIYKYDGKERFRTVLSYLIR